LALLFLLIGKAGYQVGLDLEMVSDGVVEAGARTEGHGVVPQVADACAVHR
jgi:hypothetical protein